jgi:hypothetical protein
MQEGACFGFCPDNPFCKKNMDCQTENTKLYLFLVLFLSISTVPLFFSLWVYL